MRTYEARTLRRRSLPRTQSRSPQDACGDANGTECERGCARSAGEGFVAQGLSVSDTPGSEAEATKGGTQCVNSQSEVKRGESSLSSKKRSVLSLSHSISQSGSKRIKVSYGYRALEKKLESAKRRLQVVCAENDSLRKRLGNAERRIYELEEKYGVEVGKRDEKAAVENAKSTIRESLKNGDITKQDILFRKNVEPSKRKGIHLSVFIAALSEMKEEVLSQENDKGAESEQIAVARHDSRRLELGIWDKMSEPHDLLDKLDRELLSHIACTVGKCERKKTEVVEIKPIYMSLRKIVFQGEANLMRCQRNSVRELIGKPAKRKYKESGPKASEIRTLLLNRYMAEEAPHDDFETDAMDESMGNDVKTVARMVIALQVLGLPGGIVDEVEEAAQQYSKFAEFVANSDSNVRASTVAKELKRIIDTRKDTHNKLIYLKKLLAEVVNIGHQPRVLKDMNRCTDLVIRGRKPGKEEPKGYPSDLPLLGWK